MIDHLQTVFAAIIAFGVLIVIHELGHYWVARLCGVKVLRFSVGMGKVIFSRRFGPDATEWAISILPLGGYVKMLDAREQDVSTLSPQDLKREFTRQSVWRRMAIVVAGPAANFLLAIVVFSGLYMHGIPEPSTKLHAVPQDSPAYQAGLRGGETVASVNGEPVRVWSELHWKLLKAKIEKASVSLGIVSNNTSGRQVPTTVVLPLETVSEKDLEGDFMEKLGLDVFLPQAFVENVIPNGPAMRAGMKNGDVIVAVDGVVVPDREAFTQLIKASAGKPLKITVSRNQQPLILVATPEGQSDGAHTVGKINVELGMLPLAMVTAGDTPIAAAGKAVQKTWETSLLQLNMIGKLITGEASLKNITGPITVADYAGKTMRQGLPTYIRFIAFISISLGVMNLLPIPVLDGGLLLYYSLEVLMRRPVSERLSEIGQRVGVGILMTLMVVALYNDIYRQLL